MFSASWTGKGMEWDGSTGAQGPDVACGPGGGGELRTSVIIDLLFSQN